MKTVILLPELGGYYESYYVLAQRLADADTLITENFEQVRDLLKAGQVSRIVVILGADKCPGYGRVNPRMVYAMLKEQDPLADIRIVDAYDWGIEGQYFLLGSSVEDVIKTAAFSSSV